MKKKIFSMLVLLMTAVSGAWAQEETLLTTITPTGDGTYSETTAGAVTVTPAGSFFYSGSSYGWRWDSYGSLTVTANEGYTITRCVFIQQGKNQSVTISEAPFELNFEEFVCYENYSMDGVTSIEVYGTAPAAPASATNYYLVGTMNDWGASKQFLLTPNPDNAAEYMITLNLKAGTQLKVIGVDGENTTWYPSGDNYYVNTAGQYTVYFRPDGQGGDDWHYGCIYLDAAPAPAIPLTDLGDGQWQFEMPDYAVVAKIEYDTELELQEENVNTAVLADWDGYEADITLKRTLKANTWNTLALPFSISSDELTALNNLLKLKNSSFGFTVKQLTGSSIEGETITLNFVDATSIEAGKPYLVKVIDDSDFDFSKKFFPNYEISKNLVPVETTYADFIPTLGKTLVTGPEGDKDNKDAVLFVATGNKLVNPTVVNDPDQQSSYMKGFRAYFQLKNVPAEARTFALNLGDEETGIATTDFTDSTDGSWYDLQGRKVNAAQKGVYIQNGKKVVVK